MISPEQIRASRAMLDWSTADLAKLSGMTVNGLNKIERAQVSPHKTTLENLQRIFEEHGLEFIRDTGVNRRDNTLQFIEGENPYQKLLDDVYYTLKEAAEKEALFSFVRNKLSSLDVFENLKRIRKSGATFRSLIEEKDNYCFFPLSEYRQISSAYFCNNPQIIYGDKVGTMIYRKQQKAVLIVKNEHFADAQRNMFNLAWASGVMPKTSSYKDQNA